MSIIVKWAEQMRSSIHNGGHLYCLQNGPVKLSDSLSLIVDVELRTVISNIEKPHPEYEPFIPGTK